jgi:prepilin-type processing-associated H-X9-DG protein
VLIAESITGNNILPNWNAVNLYSFLHQRQRNYLFADGHVESCPDPAYFGAQRKFIQFRKTDNCELWWFNTHNGNNTPPPPAPLCL